MIDHNDSNNEGKCDTCGKQISKSTLAPEDYETDRQSNQNSKHGTPPIFVVVIIAISSTAIAVALAMRSYFKK